MDFSLYDARRAGFEKVIFIIKKENEKIFRECIGDRISQYMDVEYVFQEISHIPSPYQVPEGRIKPWGTGHAVLCCLGVVKGPFAVINADDYYGSRAFQLIYDFLTSHEDDGTYRFSMIGYILKNTLTENGHVARGICQLDEKGYLTGIQERTRIIKTQNGAAYTEDEGKTWTEISPDSLVSMNMWGFSGGFLNVLREKFPDFLENNLKTNPLKCEYFLPFVVDELLQEKRATVQVLKTEDRWYGVTYHEDKETVVNAIQNLKDQGLYPENLW